MICKEVHVRHGHMRCIITRTVGGTSCVVHYRTRSRSIYIIPTLCAYGYCLHTIKNIIVPSSAYIDCQVIHVF